MRKLIMKMSMSLDGFVSDLNGANDWIFKTGDQESLAWSVGKVSEAGLIIMGRKSFEMMAPYWITATSPFAAPMNSIPKAVFTKKGFKGLDTSSDKFDSFKAEKESWANTQIFNGDLVEEIKKLKAESGKPIVALGGAGFMRSLIAANLIDEYSIGIHPVVLGSGMPIFSDVPGTRYLKLVESKVFPQGAMAHTYRPV